MLSEWRPRLSTHPEAGKAEETKYRFMKLFTEYFVPKNVVRHEEYLTCLVANIQNNLIDDIYLFVTKELPDNKPPKVHLVKQELSGGQKRSQPIFKELFAFCNKFVGEICIIANADIVFDESVKHLEDIPDGVFVALSRDDMIDNGASQDAWVFRAPVRLSDEMNFPLGWRGCDNRIARIMHDLGYEIRNPAQQIKPQHIHQTEYRTVRPRVLGPYLGVIANDDIKKPCRVTEFDEFKI